MEEPKKTSFEQKKADLSATITGQDFYAAQRRISEFVEANQADLAEEHEKKYPGVGENPWLDPDFDENQTVLVLEMTQAAKQAPSGSATLRPMNN